MTTDMLDPYAILQHFDISPITAPTLVDGGSDTTIWRVECDDVSYALRIFRSGEDDTCAREMAAMQTAANANIPVPHIYNAGIWQSHPVLLLSWLPGRPIGYELQAQPHLAQKLGILSGRMQANIHALSAPALLCSRSNAWIEWAGPDEQPLQERLRSLQNRSTTLLHLDYHFLNVLTDGENITGVLDWANARSGDPRADVARTYSILHVDAASRFAPGTTESKIIEEFAEGWLHGYMQIAGPLEDLSLFYAWAGAVMERDLAHKREASIIAQIRDWKMQWKARAGCL